MSAHGKRRERLLSLASGFDTVIVTNPKNLFYLTDFWGGGIGVVEDGYTTVITSVMEEQRASESSKDARIIPAKGMAAIYQLVKERVKGNVLLDQYDPRLPGKVDDGIFLDARRTKDAEELARITEASKRLEEVYRLLEKEIRPGRTEREVAAEVLRAATLEGLSPLAAEGSLSPVIVASGPNSALPHAELTDRKLRRGDMVVADIFFRYQGYCTDCTRTYAVGGVPDRWRENYDAVLEAQLHGLELARAGTPAKEVHGGVNDVLERHGLGRYFTHGTGHGVGIDIHERPSLNAVSADTLETGDVVTVEPGVYIPGEYGVRIEDTVALTGKRSTRNMFDYPKDLIAL